MSESNARALASNTYSIDLFGLFAHLRDVAAAYAVRVAALPGATIRAGLPRSRVGPHEARHRHRHAARDVRTRHDILDSWRLK